ncbi:hypothetical protein EDD15DRAFT_2167169 [Pisolithus albus]|nr:hypothetical protein EDD15DRAFT_2167169 [Pisolithus albus]
MVSDFVSADYGWLRSPDGKEGARVLFKAGKARDGYFTNEDVLAQTEKAMDILQKFYPDDDHIFVFDNATTHLKRANDALSARKMPKNPSKTWGIWIDSKDGDGRTVRGADGKVVKEKIRMADGQMPNGDPQPLYFPDGHEKAGWFKGMAQILVERGYESAHALPSECKDFKCPSGRDSYCCCRRLMFNQPDFANVDSLLESSCRVQGFNVVFLPKFHCELNFIEHFAIRSARFIDAYRNGLDGRQAAWAVKRYRGHRVIPEGILKELDNLFPKTA